MNHEPLQLLNYCSKPIKRIWTSCCYWDVDLNYSLFCLKATPHQHHAAALEPWNKNVRSELAEWQVFHAERASKVDESGLFLCEQMRVCRKLHKSKSCVGVSCRMQAHVCIQLLN